MIFASPQHHIPCPHCSATLQCVIQPTSRRWQIFHQMIYRCDTCQRAYRADRKKGPLYLGLPTLFCLLGIRWFFPENLMMSEETALTLGTSAINLFAWLGLSLHHTKLLIMTLLLGMLIWLVWKIPRWVGCLLSYTLVETH